MEIFLKELHSCRLFDGEEQLSQEEEEEESEAIEEPRDEALFLLVFSSQTKEGRGQEFRPKHCAPNHPCEILQTMPRSRRPNYMEYIENWRSTHVRGVGEVRSMSIVTITSI